MRTQRRYSYVLLAVLITVALILPATMTLAASPTSFRVAYAWLVGSTGTS
ncbi:MAG: hypothetical protein J7J20_05155 [Desulfurococcales archaeon]|nr:hypothetical protein [Desulfurococcales archaeon]